MSLKNPAMQKEVFKVLNFQKTSGIVAGTPFEVFDLENVEILFVIIYQTNTTPQANNLDHVLTADSETIQALNLPLANNTINYLYIEPAGISPAMGENPYINSTTNYRPFMLGVVTAVGNLGGVPIPCKSIRLTCNFDTIGTAQEYYCDVWYIQKEAG